MAREKPKKDKDGTTKTRTSPRKQQSATGGAEEEEQSQEQSEEQSQQRDESAEGDGGVAAGDGEKTEKQIVGTLWIAEQDEQIAAFFKEHTLFYDMSHAEYKNKKKQEHLLLEFARTMFPSDKCNFSLKVIFVTIFVMNLLRNFVNIWAC